MTEPVSPEQALINKGFLLHQPDGPASPNGRSFLITGTYRSGTSMAAAMLRAVGIFMGEAINDIVHEDEDVARVIEAGDRAGLRRLIAERNATYGTWGFKLPMLCRWLVPDDLRLFRAPHVIVMFRDPLAVALRSALSEYRPAADGLPQVARDLADIAGFATALTCPKLLASYEKVLAFPSDFADAVIAFCGLPRSEALRAHLAAVIEPNRADYIAGARSQYEGVIDGLRDGRLYGWCRLTGIAEPVALELIADGVVVHAFAADVFRQDLLDAGFGQGRHGFFLDVATLGLRPDAVIHVKVAGQMVELRNGGRRLDAYG